MEMPFLDIILSKGHCASKEGLGKSEGLGNALFNIIIETFYDQCQRRICDEKLRCVIITTYVKSQTTSSDSIL